MPVSLDTISTVLGSPLFSELADNDLANLANVMELELFPKGSHIFEQDTEGQALYILLSGQVGVMRKTAKKQSKDRLLAVIERGECIGEMALADGGPRSATVVALEDVEALLLSKDAYQSVRDSDPKLAIRLTLGIFRLLSKRLRQINKSLEIVHYWMFA